MQRNYKRTPLLIGFLMALGALFLPPAMTGCTAETCESSCLDQYDDCLSRAPPGASKADCSAAYDSCMNACSASNDAPE